MTDEIAEAVRLAKMHESGHDRPRDEYCPECLLCHELMESFDAESEPAAFCPGCMYQVADQLARAVLALSERCEQLEFWRDAVLRWSNRYRGEERELEQMASEHYASTRTSEKEGG